MFSTGSSSETLSNSLSLLPGVTATPSHAGDSASNSTLTSGRASSTALVNGSAAGSASFSGVSLAVGIILAALAWV
jgi:hypothetical protein